jgi:hypothetical protein
MRAAVAAAVFAAIAGYAAGRQNAPPANYQARVDTLIREYATLDTVWRTRKIRYDSVQSVYDTVRVRDTIVRNDTVFVPRAVADEAVRACQAVVETCEAQKANLTARLALAESALAAPRKSRLPIVAGAAFVLGLVVR